MKVEIKVPSMGESVTSAVISRMIVSSGSIVLRDQEIIELETDKVNQVLYAPEAGQLHLTVQVGQTVQIGELIGTVDTAAAGQPLSKPELAPLPAASKPASQLPVSPPSASPPQKP